MKGASHHGVPKGTRVRVKMRNGEVFYDRFVERNDRILVTEKRGRTPWREVDSFGPARRGGQIAARPRKEKTA